jgi:ankyrin repeat protein
VASLRGHIELAQFLVQHGADATVQDEDQRSPLHEASLGGQIELAQLLVEHSANMTARFEDGCREGRIS